MNYVLQASLKEDNKNNKKNKQSEPKQQRQQNIVLECLKLLYPHKIFFCYFSVGSKKAGFYVKLWPYLNLQKFVRLSVLIY